jgi:hypothetical protein
MWQTKKYSSQSKSYIDQGKVEDCQHRLGLVSVQSIVG